MSLAGVNNISVVIDQYRACGIVDLGTQRTFRRRADHQTVSLPRTPTVFLDLVTRSTNVTIHVPVHPRSPQALRTNKSARNLHTLLLLVTDVTKTCLGQAALRLVGFEVLP